MRGNVRKGRAVIALKFQQYVVRVDSLLPFLSLSVIIQKEARRILAPRGPNRLGQFPPALNQGKTLLEILSIRRFAFHLATVYSKNAFCQASSKNIFGKC